MDRVHPPYERRKANPTRLSRTIPARQPKWIEGGGIESLGQIAGPLHLEGLCLYGPTKIADGALTPMLGMTRMRDLRMMSRRHHAPSVKDVKGHPGLAP